VLSDARRPDDVLLAPRSEIPERLDHRLRLERSFALLVPERELLTPLLELAQPRAPVGRGVCDDGSKLDGELRQRE